MQDEQITPSEPKGQHARAAARIARQRWADEVKQALAERNLSINAAAREIGISPGRLQAWLSQDVEPSPRNMKDLARVIGRQHTSLLQLLGWLPAELGAVPPRLEATEKLLEAMAEARRWIAISSNAAGLRGGALVASALLKASDGWEVRLRHDIRGVEYPVRYSTLVAFCRSVPPDRPEAAAAPEDTDRDRAEIMALLGDAVLGTSAHWLPPDYFEGRRWPNREDLVLSVPLLRASRPRGRLPNLAIPQSIVVVGGPLTGSQEVAALLADTLDWSYFEIAAAARERFGLGADAPAKINDSSQLEVARGLLERPESEGRRTVWSYSALRPVVDSVRKLGGGLPLVVLLRAPDSLLGLASQRLELQGNPDRDLLDTAQNEVRRTLGTRQDPSTYLILDVPELPVDLRPPQEADRFFDAYVELAFQAAKWLHDQHDGPSLDDAPGFLGTLWRNRQTPPGGGRPAHPRQEAD